MNKLMAVVAVTLCLGLGACHDDEKTVVVASNPPCVEDSYQGDTRNPVWLYNSSWFGMTVRWPDGKIFVRLTSDSEQQRASLDYICWELNQLIAPACQLVTLPWYDPTEAHIVVHDVMYPENLFGIQAAFNGSVTVRSLPIGSNGTWKHAEIHIGPSNQLPAQRWNLAKRELIHALGFCGFTKCGGVMDAGAENGVITDTVRQFLRGLYSVPPGSYVGP